MKRTRHRHLARSGRGTDAELDITAFMNLMIVLVPILLLGMVFSRITVVDVVLPSQTQAELSDVNKQAVELVIRQDSMRVDYPRGVLLKRIPMLDSGEHDFELLSLVLQEVKRQLREQGIEQQGITILSEPAVDYQTIVYAMDTVRSFKALVAASVVDAALFPEISFGDAPATSLQKSASARASGNSDHASFSQERMPVASRNNDAPLASLQNKAPAAFSRNEAPAAPFQDETPAASPQYKQESAG